MLYSWFEQQLFAAGILVALFAGLNLFWLPMAVSQTAASGTLSVGATVIKSCNVNRALAADPVRSPSSTHPLQCWQPGNQQNNAVKPEVLLLNEGENQRRILVVY
ncbi:hypothetical protein RYO59_000409 [Thermosynechococcaceae cyanobacterium Okahandja]